MTVEPWFNNHQGLYHGNQPPFHDVSRIEGVDQLASQAGVVKDELLANLATPANAARCFKKHSLKRQQGWRQIELMIYDLTPLSRTSR